MVSVGQVLQIVKVTKHRHHHKTNPDWRESRFKAALRPRGCDPGCGQLQGSPALCLLLDPPVGGATGEPAAVLSLSDNPRQEEPPGTGC